MAYSRTLEAILERHRSRLTLAPPPTRSPIRRALEYTSAALHAPKHVVDVAANYYANEALRRRVLGGAEPIPTEELATEALLPAEEAKGSYAKSLARAGLRTGVGLATDPLIYGLGATKALPALARRGISGYFATTMGMGALEGAKETARRYREQGISPQAVEAAAETGISGAFALGAGKHALFPRKPKPPSPIGEAIRQQTGELPLEPPDVWQGETPGRGLELEQGEPFRLPETVYEGALPRSEPPTIIEPYAEREFLRPDMEARVAGAQAGKARLWRQEEPPLGVIGERVSRMGEDPLYQEALRRRIEERETELAPLEEQGIPSVRAAATEARRAALVLPEVPRVPPDVGQLRREAARGAAIILPEGMGRERVDMAKLQALARGEEMPQEAPRLPPEEIPPVRPETPPVLPPEVPPGIAPERPVGPFPERRMDLERRRRVEEMEPEEMRRALLTDELTGLGNRRGFEEAEPPGAIVSLDVAGLKWMNDTHGHEAGNELLRKLGDAIREEKGVSGFRMGGDEFSLHAADKKAAKVSARNIQERLANSTIRATKPGGEVVYWRGGRVDYGIGENQARADAALLRSRATAAARGQRAERGARPVGLVEVTAEGHPLRDYAPAGPGLPVGGRGRGVPGGGAPPAAQVGVREGPRVEPPPPALSFQQFVQNRGYPWPIKTETRAGLSLVKKLKAEFDALQGAKPSAIPPPKRAEAPLDDLGNPILPGEENLTPKARSLVRQSAEAIVNEAALAGEGRPGRRVTTGEGGEFIAAYGQRGGTAGTVLEGLGRSVKEMKRALKRDKGNPLEIAVHDAVRRDERVADALDRLEEPTERESYSVGRRPLPGQRGLFGEDVPELAERKKAPEQAALFSPREMLVPTERGATEGRETEGPLFTEEREARLRAEETAQQTLPPGERPDVDAIFDAYDNLAWKREGLRSQPIPELWVEYDKLMGGRGDRQAFARWLRELEANGQVALMRHDRPSKVFPGERAFLEDLGFTDAEGRVIYRMMPTAKRAEPTMAREAVVPEVRQPGKREKPPVEARVELAKAQPEGFPDERPPAKGEELKAWLEDELARAKAQGYGGTVRKGRYKGEEWPERESPDYKAASRAQVYEAELGRLSRTGEYPSTEEIDFARRLLTDQLRSGTGYAGMLERIELGDFPNLPPWHWRRVIREAGITSEADAYRIFDGGDLAPVGKAELASVGEQPTEAPPTLNLVPQRFKNIGRIARQPDGSVLVRFHDGKSDLIVRAEGELEYDPRDLKATHPEGLKPGQVILGAYRHAKVAGIMRLREGVDASTLGHEEWHFIQASSRMRQTELDRLYEEHGYRAEDYPNFEDRQAAFDRTSEKVADTMGRMIKESLDAEARGEVAKQPMWFQRVWRFLKSLWNAYGGYKTDTAASAKQRVVSGKVYEKPWLLERGAAALGETVRGGATAVREGAEVARGTAYRVDEGGWESPPYVLRGGDPGWAIVRARDETVVRRGVATLDEATKILQGLNKGVPIERYSVGEARPILPRALVRDMKLAQVGKDRPRPEREILPGELPDIVEAVRAEGGVATGKPPKLRINLDRIAATDETKRMLSRQLEAMELPLSEVQGYRSFKDMRESSLRFLGTIGIENEAQLAKAAKHGLLVNDTVIDAVRLVHAEKVENTVKAKKVLEEAERSGSGVEAAQEAVLSASADQASWTMAVKGQSASAGRALAVHRMLARPRTEAEILIGKLFKERGGLKEEQVARILAARPEDLADTVIDVIKPTTRQQLLELWKAGLLSGPPTHFANTIGNTLRGAMDLAETFITARVTEPIMARFQGREKERFIVEAGRSWAAFRAVAPEAWARAMADLGRAATLKPESLDVQSGRKLEYQHGAIPGKFGRAVRIPFRALGAMDDFFRSIAEEQELYKQSLRMARGSVEGSDPIIRAYKEARRIAKETGQPLSERWRPMHASVVQAGLRMTFQDHPGIIAEGLMAAKRELSALELLFPFVRTPARIFHATIERTPAPLIASLWGGGLAKKYRAFKAGELTGGEFSEEITKPVLGIMFGAIVAAAAQAGMVTGGGPSDPDQRNLLRDTGWQPYSFVIPTDDGPQYVSFNRFEPVSSIMGMAADLAELNDPARAGDLLDKIGGSIVDNLTSKTYLRGLEEASLLLSDPKRYGSQFVRNIVGSLVPTIVAKGTEAMDPTVRDVRAARKGFVGVFESAGKKMMSRVPGLAGTLPARVSPTGETIQRGGTGAERFLLPYQRGTGKGEEADLERMLVDIGYTPEAPSWEVTVPGTHGERARLTQREYDSMVVARQQAATRVRKAMRAPGFLALEADEKRERVRKVFSDAAKQARDRILPVVKRRFLIERRAS